MKFLKTCNKPKDDEALKGKQIKNLERKIREIAQDRDMLTQALKP